MTAAQNLSGSRYITKKRLKKLKDNQIRIQVQQKPYADFYVMNMNDNMDQWNDIKICITSLIDEKVTKEKRQDWMS